MDANKLAKFFKTELKNTQDVVLSQDSSGKYYLFGKYAIVQYPGLYKVYSLVRSEVIEFSTLKNATAFCVLEHAGKYKDANRVKSLDLKLSSIEVDIAVHKNKVRNARNRFDSLVNVTKLQEDNYKRRVMLAELGIHINNSRKIQDNKFTSKDSKIKRLR